MALSKTRVSNARGSPRGTQMPSPRAALKLRIPHPRDWQLEQMPRGCPGGDGHCWNWLMHKLGYPGRPIVSSNGHPTERITHIMHQPIPAVPIPPRATAGHLLTLSVPGVGHPQFYRGPGAGHLRTMGRPRHLTHMFSKVPGMNSLGKTRRLLNNCLSVRDCRNL